MAGRPVSSTGFEKSSLPRRRSRALALQGKRFGRLVAIRWEGRWIAAEAMTSARHAFPKLAANRTFRGDGLTDAINHVIMRR